MEFFRIINLKTQDKSIQEKLTIANLESISNELFVIGNQTTTEAQIGGIWEECVLHW